ncbi:MAG: dihydroorotate dehydrogenase electron transfer subunit [Armatimonadetes bacterium]|nr:dihydroorotate dehydrogenase electron transfer subunit [Armatimonadota bacterium]
MTASPLTNTCGQSTNILQRKCRIVEHDEIGQHSRQLVLDAPEIASLAVPGQFAHVLCGDSHDPLLRRPFSIHYADRESGQVSIVYEIRGRGTALLARRNVGEVLDVLGPLGNGFTLPESVDAPVLLVGGGCGAAPLYFLGLAIEEKFCPECMTFMMGAATADRHVCFDEFYHFCQDGQDRYCISTDDGSCGDKGFVTDLLVQHLQSADKARPSMIYACGPMPMLKAVSRIAVDQDIPCQVSVEAKMACGVGACLSCVIKVRDGDSFKYVRSCHEGPVLDAGEVIWDE